MDYILPRDQDGTQILHVHVVELSIISLDLIPVREAQEGKIDVLDTYFNTFRKEK